MVSGVSNEWTTTRSVDDVLAERFGILEPDSAVNGEIGERAAWERRVYSLRGQPPFSWLMDYAAGMAGWDRLQRSPLVGQVETPPLCLIGLAGYQVASSVDTYHMDHVALADLADLLDDDERARQLVAIEPGHPACPGGRLRDDDRQNLLAAAGPDLVPGAAPEAASRWPMWRAQAAEIIASNLADVPGQPSTPAMLRDRWPVVRQMQIRRGWYDLPDAPVQHDANAPARERS